MRVRLDIFDVTGAHIGCVADRDMSAGMHSIDWNGRDGSGREVASGIYFYRLTAGKEMMMRKCVLLR